MNALFKKSLMSTAFILMSAGVMAKNDPIIYTWSGPIEPLEPLMDFCIKKSEGYGEGLNFDMGKLTFKPSDTANKVDIEKSSKLAFTVVTRNSESQYCDGEQIPFEYKLSNYGVRIFGENGSTGEVVSSEELKLWRLKQEQRVIGKGDTKPTLIENFLTDYIREPQTMESGGDVSLWVEGSGLDVEDGDAVRVRAFILIGRYNAP